MESIIKLEDRFRAIKSLFQLQIEANAYVEHIFVNHEYVIWDKIPQLRAECISIDLSDTKKKKTIEIIYSLSNEIIELYKNLPIDLNNPYQNAEAWEKEFPKYRIDCILFPNGKTVNYLKKIENGFETHYSDEEKSWSNSSRKTVKKTKPIIFDNDGKLVRDESYTMHTNLFLYSQTVEINGFLKERIFDTQPQPESTLLITAVERSRMIEIHKYLSNKKYIDVDVASWLYRFSKHTWTNQKKKPSFIKWIGAAYHLTNVVYLICGNMELQTETAMKKAFKLPSGSNFQKLTSNNIKGDFYTDIKNMINWAERNAIK